METIELLLRALFDKAKEFDDLSEWEFIQTLLRDKYSNNMYTASQVINHQDIFNSLKSHEIRDLFNRQVTEENIISTNNLISIGNMLKDNFDDMIRVKLLTYSSITEIKYIQNILANLLWISIGGNFYPDPFNKMVIFKHLSDSEINELSSLLNLDIKTSNTLSKSERRFKLIGFLCEKSGITQLKTYIDSFYDNHLRNAIFHSKYFVNKNGFVGIDTNNVIKLSSDEIADKINKCIYLFIAINKLLEEYNNSYSGIKTIRGRQSNYDDNNINNGDVIDINVIARKNGGLVSTMQTIKSNSQENDGDDFKDKIMQFMMEFEYNAEDEE